MLSIRILLVLVLMSPILPVIGQNCDVDFPGTAIRNFSTACGGSSSSNLTLGKNTYMGDGDIFTFDLPIINISGNIDVNAQGSGKIVIPVGVTVNLDGNFKLDSKNSGCTSANPCIFEIEVNGYANFTQNFDNELVTLVWSGTGTVVVDDNFKNTSNGCMECGAGGCPTFQVNSSDCTDDGSGCSDGDFCATIINACSSDVADPVIAGCPSNQVINMTGPGCTQPVNWTPPTASDNCTLSSFSASHSPGDAFPKGTTTVIYTATDAADNIATCSFNVNVVDNAVPVITGCPANITVSANASCQAVVNWTAPAFTDNCAGGTLTTTNASGSTFNAGTTTVIYTATDAAGNIATCSFNVNVVDNASPVITGCPANITVSANASCQAIVSWTAPAFTDNCAGGTLTTTNASGSTFNAGTTTVIYTATDAADNTATCSFNVNVVDNVAPVITGCPANITVSANASCQTVVTWTAPTFTDNCGAVPITTSTLNPGHTFPIGKTEVTYTATDNLGNVSVCGFNVIVNNENLSIISNCPGDIVLKGNEANMATANWVIPTASAQCGEVTMTGSHQPGDFKVGTSKIQYSATDDAGNTSYCHFNVIVSQMEIAIDISKVVTPDGNGMNDEWILTNIEKYKDNKVVIVDRWGGLIFTGTAYDNQNVIWRGTNRSGGLVPTGTYFYTISVSFGSAKAEKSGFIELIR